MKKSIIFALYEASMTAAWSNSLHTRQPCTHSFRALCLAFRGQSIGPGTHGAVTAITGGDYPHSRACSRASSRSGTNTPDPGALHRGSSIQTADHWPKTALTSRRPTETMVIREACPEYRATRHKKNGHTSQGKQNHPWKACEGQCVATTNDRLITNNSAPWLNTRCVSTSCCTGVAARWASASPGSYPGQLIFENSCMFNITYKILHIFFYMSIFYLSFMIINKKLSIFNHKI